MVCEVGKAGALPCMRTAGLECLQQKLPNLMIMRILGPGGWAYRFLGHIPGYIELESLGVRPRHCHFYLFVCYPGDSEDQTALGLTGHELFATGRNATASLLCTEDRKLDITEIFPFLLKFLGAMRVISIL